MVRLVWFPGYMDWERRKYTWEIRGQNADVRGARSFAQWAIPLNRDTPPIDDMILFNPRDRQQRIFCGPGTDIFCFTIPWYRCLNPTEVDPGIDICFFTTLGQMAQSKKKTPGQTFTALLPWDRWLSPRRRPWDRHLLLYYPGTNGSVQPKQTLGRQTLHCSGVGTVAAVAALAATLFRP